MSIFTGKFYFETTNLKLAPFPNSLAAILRGFTFYLVFRSARFADDTDEKEMTKHE